MGRRSKHQRDSDCHKHNAKVELRHRSRDNDTASDATLFAAELARVGLTVRPIDCDGNCLFRAVTHQLLGTDDCHADLRAACTAHVAAREEHYSSFLLEEEGFHDFAEYIVAMSRDGEWGGNVELSALADLLNVTIMIFQMGCVPWVIHGRAVCQNSDEVMRCAATLALSYHDGNHYQSLILTLDQRYSDDTVHPIVWDAVSSSYVRAPPESLALRANLAVACFGGSNNTAAISPPTFYADAYQGDSYDLSVGDDPDADVDDSTMPPLRLRHSPNAVSSAKAASPRRNGPCPCNSGNVYRRCCGKRNARDVASAGVHDEHDRTGNASDSQLHAAMAAIRI